MGPKAFGGRAGTEPAGTPGDQRNHRRSKIPTVLGQLVHLPSGRRRQLFSRDDAVAFEGSQPLGEELAADARQTVDQIREPPRPQHELADDQQGPAITDDVERARRAAVLLVAMIRHGKMSLLSEPDGIKSVPNDGDFEVCVRRAVRISNRHERVIAAPPEQVAGLVSDFDAIWPTQIVPAPCPLGDRRYQEGLMVWEEFDRPGAIRAFRVILPKELRGEHWFEAQPVDGGALVRHTIVGEAVGEYEEIWRYRIEPAHDHILEAVLDNIEAAVSR